MKPPFKSNEKIPAVKPDSSDSKDENLKNSNVQAVTPQLLAWRKAVSEATSAAQLSMCVTMLFESIAWEKSIMKVVRSASLFSKLIDRLKVYGRISIDYLLNIFAYR